MRINKKFPQNGNALQRNQNSLVRERIIIIINTAPHHETVESTHCHFKDLKQIIRVNDAHGEYFP